MNPLQAAYWYFSVVFTIAFLLKPVEFLWLVPEFGERGANWSELVLMFAGTLVTARWVVMKLERPASPKRRLSIGLIAMAFVVLSDLTIAFWFRRLSLREYLSGRDLASTVSYWSGLATFAIMPLVTGRE